MEAEMKLRCSSCGTEAACECGVAYITAGEYAAKVKADNPGKSNRALAAEFGVSRKTLDRVDTPTGPNVPVEKTIGLDGKARRPPKRRGNPDLDPAKEQAIAEAVLDAGMTYDTAAETFDLASVQSVKIAVAREQGRRDAPIDPTTLPPSAQEKLQRAIKQVLRKHEAEYERRVQEGVKQVIDKTVLPHYNKKMDEFDEVIKSRKGVLTNEEFKLILSCLHPDQSASPERLREAFNLFKSHELSLRGEKEMPTSSFVMPRNYADLMKMREEVRAKRKAQKNTSKNLPGMH
jgi:transposase-like protein